MRVKLRNHRLAQELAKANISLNHWALRLGLRRGHLSQLVNGKRPYPDPETRQKLQTGLAISFDELFEVIFPSDQ